MVTWRDAVAFAEWLTQSTAHEVRLPTEAEWEYAARAGNDSEFAFGDDPEDLPRYGWCGLEESGVTHPQEVGRKLPNAWGLYDMHGNVFEWVQDWYGPLGTADLVDPTGPATGQIKVVRGGSWAKDVGSCRSNHRAADRPMLAESHIGFRVVRVGLR
jgi:formylglycine-generating enzyme required for sulfatase activity